MYTIENDEVSSEDGVEKGQCYHIVKRFNQILFSQISHLFSFGNILADLVLNLKQDSIQNHQYEKQNFVIQVKLFEFPGPFGL